MSELKLKEANGLNYACCPHCGRMYQAEKEGQEPGSRIPVDIPSKCQRCGAPMDYDKAQGFGDTLAEKEHQPELTRLGNRTRALTQPDMDEMVKAPRYKK